ncbi:MAG: PD-(D/E)XK nuclease domain-containing protein [Bacteroidales bacterium]|nr:PD-(D/E)XK nuclease domain-containing protein [Bacteroidales bacterium]
MKECYIKDSSRTQIIIAEFIQFLSRDDLNGALKKLKEFFATVPYCDNINYEGHWQQMLYVVFSMLGARADVEVRTSKGRVDMAMVYRDRLYLWEIKLNGSARKALEQIDKKNYAARFSNLPYPITKVGVNFSTRSRTITSWKIA